MKLFTLQFALLYCSIQCFQFTAGLHKGSSSSSSSSLVLPKSCLSCRGGQQQPYSSDPYASNGGNYNNYDYNYNPQGVPPQDADHIFQESVQDRVDQWRQEQIQHREQMSFMEKVALRESSGRWKLLATLGRGSRAIFFGVLMWRDLHLMELVDRNVKYSVKSFLFATLVVMFLANFAGCSAAVTGTGGHVATKRFKAILNLDKLVEIVLLFWYFLRLTILPSKHVPKEIYVASIFHSIFFLVQCQTYTKLTWSEKLAGAFDPKKAILEDDDKDEPPDDPDPSSMGMQRQYPYQNERYNRNDNYQYTA